MTIRTTVSLPVILKARMDIAARTHRINWSAIAAEAFAAELDRVEAATRRLPKHAYTFVADAAATLPAAAENGDP
jgi:predicted transcriptional regulator